MMTQQGAQTADTDPDPRTTETAQEDRISWADALHEWLGHPLLLLLVGAVITGLLVPSITHRWQTQQMGQDLKTKVIGEITDASSSTMSQLELTVLPEFGHNASTSSSATQYQVWMQKGSSIGSEIQAYFPDRGLPLHWGNFYGLMRNFYLFTYATDPATDGIRLRSIKHYFDVHGVRDTAMWNTLATRNRFSTSYRGAWTSLERLILGVRDGITGAIMDAPNPGF